MRRILATLTALSLVGTLATAQGKPSAEVGTSLGVTILSQSGADNVTHVGLPGGAGPLSTFSPIVYASIFATPSVLVEPQVSFSSTSSGGQTLTIFLVAAQVGYLFTPSATGSPYVAVSGAYQTFSPGGGATSSNGPGFGGEVGYRFKLKSSLALRIDGRYRRWFSDFKDINEIGFGLGLGAIF
jgi:hypothetical protein